MYRCHSDPLGLNAGARLTGRSSMDAGLGIERHATMPTPRTAAGTSGGGFFHAPDISILLQPPANSPLSSPMVSPLASPLTAAGPSPAGPLSLEQLAAMQAVQGMGLPLGE